MDHTVSENKKDVIEIDLQRLFKAAWKKAWLIVLVTILGAVAAFCATFYLITPMYESSAMFYVNNSSVSVGDTSFSISSGDITASKNLVDSYIVILKTRESLNDVIDYAGVDRTYRELRNMISAASVNSTEIFEVVVTGPDPNEAEEIASAIAYILPKRISTIIEGTSAKIVDSAIVPSEPSSPSYPKNIVIGSLLAFLVIVAIIVLREIFDVTIRSEEDITQVCKHPILATVPDMTSSHGKGGYYYSSEGKKAKGLDKKNQNFVGENISFVASEAYKLLRTKLQFSFADENDCHVIGVSSSLAGEGKSTSAVNLAYTMAQLDKKVLLIECDLRRPTVSVKLPVVKLPGLSNYLTRRMTVEEIVQTCQLDTGLPFYVITAGRIPPNPVELLSSLRMQKLITALRENYDYIILDLPPVGEVSDSLVAANLVDGILLIVRQNYCDTGILKKTLQQFEFVNARLLGVVVTCASERNGKYGKKYYKKYYASSASAPTAPTKKAAPKKPAAAEKKRD